MVRPTWFVYIQGEILGPLPTDTITLMLKQNRLQFADFIWHDGLPTWMRIYEVEDFRKALPAYPKAPPPSGQTSTAPPDEAPTKAQSKAPSKAQRKPPKEYHFVENPPGESDLTSQRSFPKVRRTSRVSIAAHLTTKDHGEFKVLNISEGGVFVMAPHALPIGTDLKFLLDAAEFKKPLEMTGVVIRHNMVNETPGFAIEFTRVNPAHKRLLQEYVRNKDDTSQ